ncbi:hypothetical protein ACFVZW_31520 [Streptomyces sp. NPDC059567]|uniref:hypothetical protein n=1 Tax=Streptomyces sp. NPDC059567 TaxID=3346867 RepID=UPI0036CF2501
MKTRAMSRLCRMGAGTVLLAAALVTATVQAAHPSADETTLVADHGWGPVAPPTVNPVKATDA